MANLPNTTTAFHTLKRFGPLTVIGAVVAVFVLLDGPRWVSFDTLQSQYQSIGEWVSERPVKSAALYLLVFSLMVSCALPVGSVMITLGGFLFGIAGGTVLSVASAGIGAMVLFYATRLAGGDFFERRAGPTVAKLRSGFQKDAVGYLFFMRVVPVFPFFAVTVAASLLGMSARTFLLVTVAGIAPVNAAWAALGSNLGTLLDSREAITAELLLQPRFLLPIGALAVLAVVPVLLRLYRARSSSE